MIEKNEENIILSVSVFDGEFFKLEINKNINDYKGALAGALARVIKLHPDLADLILVQYLNISDDFIEVPDFNKILKTNK